MTESAAAATLAHPDVQAQLLQESVVSGDVGFLVWDENRRYIAANQAACDILGTTCEQLLGQTAGAHVESSDVGVDEIARRALSVGTVVSRRLDGRGTVRLHYVTFRTKTAGMPYMASLITPVE